MSLYDWCIKNQRQDILDRFDYDKNIFIPQNVSVYAKIGMYLKCPDNIHDSAFYQVSTLGKHNSKLECKYCNSFHHWCVVNNRYDLLDRWDYDLNRVTPLNVARTSPSKYYFKCQRGLHESTPYKLVNLTKYSYGEAQCTRCSSIAQWGIDYVDSDFLKKYWDYDKNIGLNPWLIPYRARPTTRIYIKCQYDERHDSYKTFPDHFVSGARCPECARTRTESYLQEMVRMHIENTYDYPLTHEYNCSIVAYNTDSKHYMPYDNDVQINDKHLIIETHGKQHYEITQLTRLYAEREGITEFEALRRQQQRDQLKKDHALSFDGYHYLELSYKVIKDGSYKQLIDNTIHKILTLQND